MPVNCHILVSTVEPVAEHDLEELDSELSEAVGRSRFVESDNGAVLWREQTDYELLPDGVPRETQFLRVRLCTPYYGPGYERGSWPEIAATLEFLRRRLKNSRVWYGRDDGDWVKEVTSDSLNKLWTHWANNGGRPYYAKRASEGGMG